MTDTSRQAHARTKIAVAETIEDLSRQGRDAGPDEVAAAVLARLQDDGVNLSLAVTPA